MTSTVSCSSVVVASDSIALEQLTDVEVPAETHNEYASFNVNATDPAFADGWVPKIHSVYDASNMNADLVPAHNDLLVWNETSQDANFAADWVNKKITDLIQGLQVTVDGIVSIENARVKGREGNPGLTDAVAFTDDLTNGVTLGMGSAGNNNAVYKREPTDEDFVYLTTLGLGEVANFDLPSGTVFRSTKGICGFSAPFPMPFGVSSLSDTFFRFYAFRNTSQVFVTSAGLESIVTLYSSDGTTVVDGPETIPPFGSTTLNCGDDVQGEFVVSSTNGVYCGTYAVRLETGTNADVDLRLVPPMVLECIVWNRQCRITAQETGTLVRWYRRNGETGVLTVNAGTPADIYTGTVNEEAGPTNAGNTADYGLDGCLILRADKPISCFSGADSQGFESTPGWPLTQLAQLFPNPANVDDNADAGRSSVTVGSPYEGLMSVYDSTQTLVTTVSITRAVAVTTADDQLYPASGQWQPVDSGLTDWNGGYIITNVPCVCIMNFNGSPSPWDSDAGDELNIVGTTPEDVRAEIRKDADGFLRRRDVDASGVETWNVC